jgi:AsmA-like C-terminal region
MLIAEAMVSTAVRSMPSRFPVWRTAAIAAGIVLAAIVIGVASVVPFSSEAARLKLVNALADRLDSDVELQQFTIRVLPALRAEGRGLTIRQRGNTDLPPLISIARFSAEGNALDVLRRHVSRVTVEGLDIEIPPDRDRDNDDRADGPHGGPPPFVIDELISTDARLVIIPSHAGKDPKVWQIHRLRMLQVSPEAMPFEATLTNAVPPGEIETRGSFGPWHRERPGRTPLNGSFTFDRADLGVFKGISGILSARGTFGGALAHIDVHGETDTPDFTVAAGGHPVHLKTKYQAIVDGTNGNTTLAEVDGSFLNTSLVARGTVAGQPGVKGRTVTLDVTMEGARLEDVLRLAVNTPRPPMTGALALTTKFELPPDDIDVVKKLRLDGRFSIGRTRFTNPTVQNKINELSHRSRGKSPDERTERVASQFDGLFRLRDGVITIPSVTFDIPGAVVRLAGKYGIENERIDFAGTVFMDAKISETVTGYKRLLLKIADPLFTKKGGGSAIPIKISGTRNDPHFGLDAGRIFNR